MNNYLSIIGLDVWGLIIEFFELKELHSFMLSSKFFKKIIDDMPLKHIKCFKLDKFIMYCPVKLYKLFAYAPKKSLWLNKFYNYETKSNQNCFFWKSGEEKYLINYTFVKSIMEENTMILTLLIKYYYIENITFDVLSNIFVLLMDNSSNELNRGNKINNMNLLNKYLSKINPNFNFNFNFNKNVKINMHYVLPIIMGKLNIVKAINEHFGYGSLKKSLKKSQWFKDNYSFYELDIIEIKEGFCGCEFFGNNKCHEDHEKDTILFSWEDICKHYVEDNN